MPSRARVNFATTAVIDEEKSNQTKQHAFYSTWLSQYWFLLCVRRTSSQYRQLIFDLDFIAVIVIDVNHYNSNTAWCQVNYASCRVCLTRCYIPNISGSHYSRQEHERKDDESVGCCAEWWYNDCVLCDGCFLANLTHSISYEPILSLSS